MPISKKTIAYCTPPLLLIMIGVVWCLYNNSPNNSTIPLMIRYKFDRYETQKNDCSFPPSISYHNAATLSFTLPSGIKKKHIKYIEILDLSNSIVVRYEIDHDLSNKERIFYHMPLFGKKKHYEYIELDSKYNKELYVFFYYNYYGKTVQKKSFLKLKGISSNGVSLFETESVEIDYTITYVKDRFPEISYRENKDKSKINIEVSGFKDIAYIDLKYKYKGELLIKEFILKENEKSLDVPMDKYDSYLAIMVGDSSNYENKIVVFRSCGEEY